MAIALVITSLPSIATARPSAREPSIVDIALSVNADSGEFSTLIDIRSSNGIIHVIDMVLAPE